MARVIFAPYQAIKYIGQKTKEFSHSLARPRPTIRRGDILIVDKKTAFNLVNKGFGEFEAVDSIEFVKADTKNAEAINNLNKQIETLTKDRDEHKVELESTKSELEAFKGFLDDETNPIPELATFEDDKDKLEDFARTKGVELDKRNTIESMYESFKSFFKTKED